VRFNGGVQVNASSKRENVIAKQHNYKTMNPDETRKTLEDHLIEQVKKSGFPLEIEISNILDGKDYIVFNSQYYFDEELQQGRDIDLYAVPLDSDPLIEKISKKILPLVLRLELAIECKKSESYAWVFYTRPRIPENIIYMEGQLTTTFPEIKGFSGDSSKWLLEQECLKLHYDRFDRIAVAYDELKKGKANEKVGAHRNEIFEATNQLIKFVNYLNHHTEKNLSELPKDRPKRELMMILFPIIVCDGDMFEVFFKGGEPTLWKTKHVLLSTNRHCPYCKESKSFTIDVVHRSYFEEFIDSIKTPSIKMNKVILEKHKELLSKIKNDRLLLDFEKNQK